MGMSYGAVAGLSRQFGHDLVSAVSRSNALVLTEIAFLMRNEASSAFTEENIAK